VAKDDGDNDDVVEDEDEELVVAVVVVVVVVVVIAGAEEFSDAIETLLALLEPLLLISMALLVVDSVESAADSFLIVEVPSTSLPCVALSVVRREAGVGGTAWCNVVRGALSIARRIGRPAACGREDMGGKHLEVAVVAEGVVAEGAVAEGVVAEGAVAEGVLGTLVVTAVSVWFAEEWSNELGRITRGLRGIEATCRGWLGCIALSIDGEERSTRE
jgi:hypothetical protein